MNASVIDVSPAQMERRERPSNEVATMPAATPMQILAMAVQRGVDPETLRKMMDLQERYEANQARKAFEAAVSAAKAEIKPILKRQEVDFTSARGRTNYKYEDLSDIATAVDPVLAAHGLSYRHRSKQDGKKLAITCILAHRDGHFEETTLAADNDESGNKSSIQAIGSTATFLQRYTLKLALGLATTKDDDGRGAGGDKDELVTAEQVTALTKLITDGGGELSKALRFLSIKSLEEIPAKNFEAVKKQIESVNAAKARAKQGVPK